MTGILAAFKALSLDAQTESNHRAWLCKLKDAVQDAQKFEFNGDSKV
jgi:hypothetical protein